MCSTNIIGKTNKNNMSGSHIKQPVLQGGGRVGIAYFNFNIGNTPKVRPLTAYALPYYLKTKFI